MAMYSRSSSRMFLMSTHRIESLLTVIFLCCNVSFGSKQLTIGGMFPFTGTSGFNELLNGTELKSICSIAVDLINSRVDILPSYDLNILYSNTQCDEGTGTRLLFEYLLRKPPLTMLLGPGCSSVTKSVARSAWQWNLVQVTYASTESDLSTNKDDPFLYRVISSNSARLKALLSFLKYNKWSRVALLGDEDTSQVIIEVRKGLKKNNITVINLETSEDSSSNQVKALKAHKEGIFGNRYAWIFPIWFGDDWWNQDGVHCNKGHLIEFLRGSFHFDSKGIVTDDNKEPFGMGALKMKRKLSKKHGFTSDFSLYAFDAIWTIALALHNVSQILATRNISLDVFDYQNTEIAYFIRSAVRQVAFQGTTGDIRFDSNGDRDTPISIKRFYSEVTFTTIAVYDVSKDSLVSNLTAGSYPYDRQIVQYMTINMPWELFWSIVGFTSCSVLISLLFLVFNLIYRNYRFIQLSSPNINNVIVLGALFVQAAVIGFLLDSRIVDMNIVPVTCSVTGYFLSIGYSLFLGGMVSKTWRVYQILHKKYIRKKVFSVSQLVGPVIIVTASDLLIMILWTAVDPFVIARRSVSQSWYYIIIGCKVLFLLVGCFIAMETRQVEAKALNDSKLIGSSIYIVTAFALIGLPLVFVISDNIAAIAITCFTLVLTTIVCLCVIFIPKIIILRRINKETPHLDSQSAGMFNNDVIEKTLTDGQYLKRSDSLDETPNSSRKNFTSRANTFQESPKLQSANENRRYNTISSPSAVKGKRPRLQDEHGFDLKVENASLRRKLHQTKITEASKMCKVLYENSELNRKLVELSMTHPPGHDVMADTVSRLTRENNELKRQLGEVSILNSASADATPRTRRKLIQNNERDLRELQKLLTVDLGGGRTSSLRFTNKRPPTIGLSQSSLDLSDTQENHHDCAGFGAGQEKNEIESFEDICDGGYLQDTKNGATKEMSQIALIGQKDEEQSKESIQNMGGLTYDSKKAEKNLEISENVVDNANDNAVEDLEDVGDPDSDAREWREIRDDGSADASFYNDDQDTRKPDNKRGSYEQPTKCMETLREDACKNTTIPNQPLESTNLNMASGETGGLDKASGSTKRRKSKRDKKTTIAKVEKTFFV